MMVLEVQKANIAYGGVKALDNCSFSIDIGKITALVGPNGAGKTTLFNAVNGFADLDSGRIRFKGVDITKVPAWRRSRLGMSRTFQSSRVFHNLSVRDNLLLALRDDDDQFFKMVFGKSERGEYEEKIKEAMGFVGLKKDLDSPSTDLSYGEQKLFGLARALVNPHSILLLDEPVAGVNPVIRKKLIELLLKLKQQGETIFLVEHDMDFVRSVADYAIVMDQGAVLAEGLPKDVFNNKKVLEAYLGKE